MIKYEIFAAKYWILFLLILAFLSACTRKAPQVVDYLPTLQSNTEKPNEAVGLVELLEDLGVGDNKQITPKNVNKLTELRRFGKGAAYDIDIAPDGQKVAVASATGIYLYSLPELLAVDFLPVGYTDSLEYSPDGNLLAMILRKESHWSSPESLSVWDMQNGRELWRMELKEYIHSFDISLDSQYLICTFEGDLVRAWNLRDGEAVTGLIAKMGDWQERGKPNWTTTVSQELLKLSALGPDGFHTFDLRTGKELGLVQLDQFVLTKEFLPQYALSSDWKHLAIRQHDGKIGLWNALEGNQLWEDSCASNTAYEVVFSPNGKLLGAIDDENVCVWDVYSGARLQTLPGEDGDSVWDFDFSSDGDVLVSHSREQITLWNIANGEGIESLHEHGFGSSIAAISPDGKLVAAGYSTGEVRVWDANTETLLWEKEALGDEIDVQNLQFSSDGLTLLVDYRRPSDSFRVLDSFSGDELYLWDVSWDALPYFFHSNTIDITNDGFIDKKSGRQIIDRGDLGDEEFRSWALSRDGSRLAISSMSYSNNNYEYFLRIWDTSSGKAITVLEDPADLFSMIFSPDGLVLAGRTYDGIYLFWNTRTGEQIQSITQVIQGDDVIFSPNGQVMAIRISGDQAKIKSFTLWDVKSGKQTCYANQSEYFKLEFSPDGQIIAVESDGDLRLWDAKNCDLLLSKKLSSAIASFTFSQDGNYLVTGDATGVVKIWGIP